MWLRRIEVSDLRNLREVDVELAPGVNIFVGRNAQGKTSLLEAAALLARGRSFRTEESGSLVRRGAAALHARGTAVRQDRGTHLEVELGPDGRRLRVDGHEVAPGAYQGRLEAVVYATDRLRIVRGSMRERRLFLDRGAAGIWPAYRREIRDYERVVSQRSAAIESGAADLGAWDGQLAERGARVRRRRAEYARRLERALAAVIRPAGESYGIAVWPHGGDAGESAHRDALLGEIRRRRVEERRARACLVGPHRDRVELTVDGQDAGVFASSGQARSLLLALTLAQAAVYREERGATPVALLDDLDSELDQERTEAVCREVGRTGQALVTTAHPQWVQALAGSARIFEVHEGRVARMES